MVAVLTPPSAGIAQAEYSGRMVVRSIPMVKTNHLCSRASLAIISSLALCAHAYARTVAYCCIRSWQEHSLAFGDPNLRGSCRVMLVASPSLPDQRATRSSVAFDKEIFASRQY